MKTLRHLALNSTRQHKLTTFTCASLIALGWVGLNARADGIYGNGVGAQSMGMGGADVAWAADPLSSMGLNPAGIAFLDRPQLSLGGVGGFATGDWVKGPDNGTLTHSGSALPEGAFAMPLGTWPLSVGLSFVPESALYANWHYDDPAGGLGGVTYGYQQDKSEIVVLRSALGFAGHIGTNLSFGASGGAVYNQNELVGPYIFQSMTGGPLGGGLNGAKTLLDLRTTGWGANANAGMLYKLNDQWQFGLAYESQTRVDTHGNASGNPYAQVANAPFHYDAEVKNIFPQSVSLGSSWKFHPQVRASLQVDWIDWANAFNNLPVNLTGGNNSAVNSLLGSSFQDHIPLDWKNEFVYRTGLEFLATKNLTFRAGYAYGGSPVPDSTLTPLTAAITENTITAGVGYVWDRYHFDFAYQYSLPATQHVGTSGLLSGEYSDSTTVVSTHIFALTVGVHF